MVWRTDWFQFIIESGTPQYITCAVDFIPKQLKFLITFVYAFNNKAERKCLWDLSVRASTCQMHWIVLEEFNNVLHDGDRTGELPITFSKVIDFQNCIDLCGLTEFQSTAYKYTA